MTSVSVVVPVHDGAAHLPRCLAALLRQKAERLEVIVVDDASTDDSARIVDELAAHDPRVRLLRLAESRGAGAARNAGLAAATGEYVAFVDADDECEDDYLGTLVETAERERADVVVCGFSHLSDDGPRPADAWGARPGPTPPTPPTPPGSRERARRLVLTNPAPWNKLFRQSFLAEHGLTFLETRSANDLSFTYGALGLADVVARVDEPLIRYRVATPGGISTTDKDPHDLVAALRQVRRTFAEHGRERELRPAFLALVAAAVLTALHGTRTPEQHERAARALVPLLRTPGVTRATLLGLGPRRLAQLLALRVLGPRAYRAALGTARSRAPAT